MSQQGTQLQLFEPMARPKDLTNARQVMVWHFFALDTKSICQHPILFTDGTVQIEVQPSKWGLANMLDKDLLVYIASLMHEIVKKGGQVPRTVTFTLSDYCRASGRQPGGSAYNAARASIKRLQGTQISTNIRTGGQFHEGFFSWIKAAEINGEEDKLGNRRMTSITVEPCDWLRRAVSETNDMLVYDKRYFDLSPLDRRIYELARCHIGDGDGFIVDLDTLQQHTGTGGELKKLKFNLATLMKSNSLPNYGLSFADARALDAGPIPEDRRIPLQHIVLAIWPRPAGATAPKCFSHFQRWNPIGQPQLPRSH